MSESKRAVIFANGELTEPASAVLAIQPGDLLIAADGGARLCRQLGFSPNVLVGDFDSLRASELEALLASGAQAVRYPQRKDYTDLELALRYAQEQGCTQVTVLGALGARWDQTLANLLLPGAPGLEKLRIRLLDGRQEMSLVRPGEGLEIIGRAGDTVSLLPLAGDALGVRTEGLEYPLGGEWLLFGATRGISNTLLSQAARVTLEDGLLLCVVIHH